MTDLRASGQAPTEATAAGVIRLQPPAPVASVQGTLALDLQPRQDPPPLRACGAGRSADVIDIGAPTRRQVERWAHRYVQAAVEIVGGDRPVTQLLRWSSREVFENLDRRARLVAHAGHHQPGQGRVQPVRPRVHSVHACFLAPTVVEVGVHVRYGPRSRAVAARFEHRREHGWCCTALDFS